MKRKESTRFNSGSSFTWKTNYSNDEKVVSKPTIEASKDRKKSSDYDKGKYDSKFQPR